MQIAEIILPLPLPGTFSYQIPVGMQLAVGYRVIVPFGKRKIYTGVVATLKETTPNDGFQMKEIMDVLDDHPILSMHQLSFIRWISSYYLCTLGDAYNAALPAGLKLTSESFISLQEDAALSFDELTENEIKVLSAIRKKDISTEAITEITGLKSPYQLVKKLKEAQLIDVYEKVKDRYQPKKETRIRLSQKYQNPDALEEIVNSLDAKPKQQDILMQYLQWVPVLEHPAQNKTGISKKSLIDAGLSDASLKTLIKNEILEVWEQKIDRFAATMEIDFDMPQLTAIQTETKQKIENAWKEKDTVLLKGITGSGKTEIYIHLIQNALNSGNQVLLLLPEIALTTQIITRFRRFFGNSFGVYHSRFSDNERAEVYQKCLNGTFNFIIGVRSAVFLPFSKLGLLIVDEEHEPSYKQYDPAPRYHARDAAIYLSQLHQAKVLLGSATPSLESYHNARESKFGYVALNERYDHQPLAEIVFADLLQARKQRRMKGSFTSALFEAVESSILNGKQVILFQNRRGYAPFLQCDDCNEIPKCQHCSVSLTYHIYQNELICHYCGYRRFHDAACTSCGSTAIRSMGVGTEKIEEEIQLLLPDVPTQRMDLDTTRNKNSYQQIIDDFENGNTKILIGTQMVSKGLDFEHVNLVGIFDADRILHYPDFRAHERAFQLITQVSGRSGRKHERGKVIIQTNDPNQTILRQIKEGHLDLFYQNELSERQQFNYPPYTRLIKCYVRHKEKSNALNAAHAFYKMINAQLGDTRTFGPIEPLISKIRNYYIYEILIKLDKKTIDLARVKQFLLLSRDSILVLPANKSVLIHFDVDPL